MGRKKIIFVINVGAVQMYQISSLELLVEKTALGLLGGIVLYYLKRIGDGRPWNMFHTVTFLMVGSGLVFILGALTYAIVKS